MEDYELTDEIVESDLTDVEILDEANADPISGDALTLQPDDPIQIVESDLTFQVAAIFVIACVFGVMIFNIFSKRWFV